jgi:hypothetical protein
MEYGQVHFYKEMFEKIKTTTYFCKRYTFSLVNCCQYGEAVNDFFKKQYQEFASKADKIEY